MDTILIDYFDPRGSREPRRTYRRDNRIGGNFDPRGSREPRPLSDGLAGSAATDFDPRGSREPRQGYQRSWGHPANFDPRGSREPRHTPWYRSGRSCQFRSTRLSRAPTIEYLKESIGGIISIHEALASPDPYVQPGDAGLHNFDPRGSREPRHLSWSWHWPWVYFDPRGSREPRHKKRTVEGLIKISIHEALASPDSFTV